MVVALLRVDGSPSRTRVRPREPIQRAEATSHGPSSYLQGAAALGDRSSQTLKLLLEGNAMGIGAGYACPAYPWPQGGHQGGQKVFMQSDCAVCHSMLPYAGLREAAPSEMEAKVAEIVVVNEEQPATARPAYMPVTTKMVEGLRRNKLYTAQELKMALPTPVWLQFLHPYIRARQTA